MAQVCRGRPVQAPGWIGVSVWPRNPCGRCNRSCFGTSPLGLNRTSPCLTLVQDPTRPTTEREAEKILKDTDAAAKNELLFSRFGINYAHLPEMFRKGSVLFRRPTQVTSTSSRDGVTPVVRTRHPVVVEHRDIIGDAFWEENPHVLEG
ncbi:Thg1 C terminal domain-containing protein [Blyttiomyces helicus]|uniref:Thg1 C terminal domain-containing protein n=1 Tax=Blyttiomyces helicus TaxID=388810 RepID=A0A4P9WDV2_9FUNG|nr:Thg1 C terminal domain-containing protein [Blyttiomyces helicus]|eukprot:RKO90889.1 Thg1 C terminal domain-containing protein [Blyttiomyces helicus]